jgi:3-dehydroquinate dehydratase/shikimate dehydrogenase
MTYLAVPIAGIDIDQTGEQIKAAKKAGADMLELRTDYLANLNIGRLKALIGQAKTAKLPTIVTCRDKAQGGTGDWDTDLRSEILVEAVTAGVDFVDCEYNNFAGQAGQKLRAAMAQNHKTRLILSAHNFDGPYDNKQIARIYDEITQAYPEAIPKIVYTADHINDCFAALDLMKNSDRDAIVIAMGNQGIITRILAKKFRAFLTFASIDENAATAQGQITIQHFKKLYRWDAINPETEVFGVIGSPIAHSISPAVFNACFQDSAINAIYIPILLKGQKPQFNEFMRNILDRPWLGFGGFSVTIPHKAHALDYVNAAGDFVEPLAENIGAVNTLKVGFGAILSGYNTDYAGAMDALLAALEIDRHQMHDVSVTIVGAGGVARAVVAGLADVGAKITIYNRTVQKAKALSAEFACKYAGLDELPNMQAQVLINCTSIGMTPDIDASPVPQTCLSSNMAVFDTVYNPLKTKLLLQAEQAGAKTINGAEMFISQAIAQYKLFIGEQPKEETIRKTVYDSLGE